MLAVPRERVWTHLRNSKNISQNIKNRIGKQRNKIAN